MRNTTAPTSRRMACFTTPATWRCCAPRSCGAPVVLASATPSLESWANAEAGKYARLDLGSRFGVAELPAMPAIDMRAEKLPSDRWISADAGARGRGADGAGRTGAAVPEPARLCAGDALPRLRASGRLRPLRCADGRASVPQAAGLPPVRRDQADPAGLPELQGRGADGPGRAGGRAAGRGGGGALSRGAGGGAVVGPLRVGARAEGADRR